jgi:hypothetical protein
MTWLARLVLVLTCLAPVAFVQAAVETDRQRYRLALWLVVAVVGLVAVCHGLLWGVRHYNQPVPKEISEPEAKDNEPLAFLVSYALPLVAAKDGDPSLLALAAFGAVMAIALWQLQVFHVNPLLAMFGYRFYGAKSGGARVVVLSRSVVLPSGNLSVFRVSDYLFYYCEARTGGGDGSAAGRSAQSGDAGGAS